MSPGKGQAMMLGSQTTCYILCLDLMLQERNLFVVALPTQKPIRIVLFMLPSRISILLCARLLSVARGYSQCRLINWKQRP